MTRPLKYLLDAEGFYVSGKFLTKELGVCDVDTGEISSRYYRVGEFRELTLADRRHVAFVKNNVHGMWFDDRATDEPQSDLEAYILSLCETANRQDRTIGYKGGNYERDLLHKHGYSHLAVNLEDLGCQRFDQLVRQFPEWYKDARSVMCDRHTSLDRVRRQTAHRNDSRLVHCPRIELWYFAKWLRISGVFSSGLEGKKNNNG